jgi:hypothetical protein
VSARYPEDDEVRTDKPIRVKATPPADELEETVTTALNAATPGPWHWWDRIYEATLVSDAEQFTGLHDGDILKVVKPDGVSFTADGHLIANAPTWLAALVAENRELRAVLEADAAQRLLDRTCPAAGAPAPRTTEPTSTATATAVATGGTRRTETTSERTGTT